MSKIEQVVNFFRNHPRFPFLNWNTNYDDYCAMFLCLTNILKCYIPEESYTDCSYAYGYMEFRGNPEGIVAFPLTCKLPELELVIFLGTREIIQHNNGEAYFSVQISRDARWGDRWEANAPEDEWYNEIAILFDFNNPVALQKIGTIFKTVFEKKMTFKDLKSFEESNLNFDDE
ncbi:hypothetical protein ABKPCSM17A_02326 [Acinetobacter baumannii]|uniref:hypothetical protein n=1 Tax=Acinetobacter baumannii TaxID=470 RepID=UPI0013608588|nr:hypothetical protein [Acinetobacter baumannii]MDC5350918.1 hypothetical protein [Acinetobacter baumannii]CAA0235590.1 hypothetical protein ABKPCSM17A_02326 [Acinetobacter baumannii]